MCTSRVRINISYSIFNIRMNDHSLLYDAFQVMSWPTPTGIWFRLRWHLLATPCLIGERQSTSHRILLRTIIVLDFKRKSAAVSRLTLIPKLPPRLFILRVLLQDSSDIIWIIIAALLQRCSSGPEHPDRDGLSNGGDHG